MEDIAFLANNLADADLVTWQLTAWKVIALYLGKAIFPVVLSADYSFAQITLWGA